MPRAEAGYAAPVTPIDLERIRADVHALAAMTRDSAGAGERRSAAWLAGRLREQGAQVEVQSYRGAPTFGHVTALLAATALAGSLTRWRLPAGAAVLALWEADASGRARPLRRALPRGEGANVVARVPASGEARGTVVLVAHHDAARTGLMWHPRITEAGAARHARRRRIDPYALPAALAVAGAALGLRAARVGLAAVVALQLEVARGATVPGADDNATGVAVALDLARAPQEHLDLVVVLPGGEEAGMEGFAAALRRLDLDPARTFVLGLDTLGAGTPIVLEADVGVLRHRYRREDLALADAGAAAAGEPPPERWRIGGWTDPLLARHAGLRAISLLSIGPGHFPHYHRPTDTPEHVDWRSVERCARLARGIVAAYAAAPGTTQPAIATKWQTAAAMTNAWKTSWKPKTRGHGSGRRRA